ncbi:MAG TPA: hypothetical protein VF950_28310 [Planctomycetota bacterium]
MAAFVNANFVAAWHNRAPGFKDLDYKAENDIFTRSVDAYPTMNICTFFLAPDGRVFHYVAGHQGPTRFLETLRLAARVRAEAFDAKMGLRPDGLRAVQAIHAERAAALKAKGFEPETGTLSYRGLTHTHGKECAWALEELRKYLRNLHERQSKLPALATIDEIRYAYDYGNSFSEEAPGAAPLKGRALSFSLK